MNTVATSTSFQPRLFGRAISLGNLSFYELMFVILGGLPLFLPAVLYLGETGLAQQHPIYWYFWSNALISMPHTCATYARLDRKIRERKVSFWFGIPLYAAIVAALMLASQAGLYLVTMTAVNVWQSYHYVRQVYGVSSLYSTVDKSDPGFRRQFFWAYHAAMPLFILGRWDVLYTVWNGVPSDAIIPVRIPFLLIAACVVLAVGGLSIGLKLEYNKFKQSANGYDCTGLIALCTYFLIHWYGFLSVANFQRGFIAVTVFHAIQYIALVWFFESRHRSQPKLVQSVSNKLPILFSFLAFWLFLYIVGSIVQDHILTIGNAYWMRFSTICLAAVSAHHYAVDAVMWGRKSGS